MAKRLIKRLGPSGIYAVVNLMTNKIYVGSGVDTGRRICDHTRELKLGVHANWKLSIDAKKYGAESFVGFLLEACEPEKLVEREQFWIDKLNAVSNGYNVCPKAYSSLGLIRRPETRLKVSNGLKGKVQSQETREKRRAAWTPEMREMQRQRVSGHKQSPETLRKKLESLQKFYAENKKELKL